MSKPKNVEICEQKEYEDTVRAAQLRADLETTIGSFNSYAEANKAMNEIKSIEDEANEIALKFIESDEVRQYFLHPDVDDSMWRLSDVICKSRACLMNKAEALREISEKPPFDAVYQHHTGALAEQAFNALEETKISPSGCVFILTLHIIDEDVWNYNDYFGRNIKKYSTPFATFEQAVAFIDKENAEIYDGVIEMSDDFGLWFNITRWDKNSNGELKEVITWVLGNTGTIWGFCRVDDENNINRDNLSYFPTAFIPGYGKDLNFPVPFIVGDIITVDMRPFVDSFDAVIIWKSDNNMDCCTPKCLFIKRQRIIEIRSLKHLVDSCPCFSPLLRAKQTNKKLTECNSLLKRISNYVKKDNTLIDKLYALEEEKGEIEFADIESLIM